MSIDLRSGFPPRRLALLAIAARHRLAMAVAALLLCALAFFAPGPAYALEAIVIGPDQERIDITLLVNFTRGAATD
jgi:hypothetical protein